MSDKTVKQLAEAVGIPLEKFLEQLREAGLTASAPDDLINEQDKLTLLAHLRKRHGKSEDSAAAPRRVTLKRRTVTEIKQGSVPGGAAKTISVEVRKKKTFIKKAVTDSAENADSPAVDAPVEAQISSHAEAETTHPVEPAPQTQQPTASPETPVSEMPEVSAEVERPEGAQSTAQQDVVTEEFVAEVEPELPVAVETVAADDGDKKAKVSDAERKRQEEKEKRLEEAIERNAEKVRRLAAARSKEKQKRKVQTPAQAQTPAPGRRGKKGKAKVAASSSAQNKHQFAKPVAPVVKEVAIPEQILVSDLAQKMSVKAAEVIKQLMKLGMMATINQSIDQETAALVVEEMGHQVVMQSDDDVEAELLAELRSEEGALEPRAPIVTIMGHVDHGKTSLLDYIRSTRVASGEAGGITQHIGAYRVVTDHGSVTFLDTPGHAAFTAMRARGAEVTDVVIVVVAADDGVMPQTKEAVEHARAGKVPIIVAMNKIDKPEANPDRVMQELSAIDVIPEDWGGDVQFIKVSAKTGEGIDDLIEALILQTEILELKAPAEGAASGIVIESRLDKGRGAVATVIVQQGLLEKGQFVLCGQEYGRVRAMFNENGKSLKEAGPSAPVEILGLSSTPNAGDEFLVVQNERAARELAQLREEKQRSSVLHAQQSAKLDQVFSRMGSGEILSLNVVLKTDVQGSLEALRESLAKLSTEEVEVKVVYGGVGGINESDANLALASGAILMGFNVRADATARKTIEEKAIDLHYYSVIYDAIDEVKQAISGMLAPEIKESIVGLAEVRDVFRSPKFGAVAGCMVIEGFVKRNLPIRVLRDNVVIYEGQLESLRRFKDDVQEVKNGMECGIGVKNYNDVKTGDHIEVFERVEVKREL
ncbi:MAG: translation initiation factor IF-2 [Methylococcales bacterium]|nr:translation initiation factor IF-2 [Methylococcales bacterium]